METATNKAPRLESQVSIETIPDERIWTNPVDDPFESEIKQGIKGYHPNRDKIQELTAEVQKYERSSEVLLEAYDECQKKLKKAVREKNKKGGSKKGGSKKGGSTRKRKTRRKKRKTRRKKRKTRRKKRKTSRKKRKTHRKA